jgi:hypothetical protein
MIRMFQFLNYITGSDGGTSVTGNGRSVRADQPTQFSTSQASDDPAFNPQLVAELKKLVREKDVIHHFPVMSSHAFDQVYHASSPRAAYAGLNIDGYCTNGSGF